MLKIKDMYQNLKRDDEIIFQVKTKKMFDKIIQEMKLIFDKWDFIFIENYLNYKTTYFIVGKWRDGMFKIKTSKKNDFEHELYILADYKESPINEKKHLKQINDLINIMDKYRIFFVKKKLTFDNEFNLIEKVDD